MKRGKRGNNKIKLAPFIRDFKKVRYCIMAILIKDKNQLEELKTDGRPILLDFYADWCGPCRMVAPIIEEIANENPDIIVGKINVDDVPDLASEFGVFSIPTLAVIKDGKVVAKSAGARPKEQIIALVNG